MLVLQEETSLDITLSMTIHFTTMKTSKVLQDFMAGINVKKMSSRSPQTEAHTACPNVSALMERKRQC